MKVIFVSGGSGGPTAPLIGVYEQFKDRDPDIQVLWLGTRNGVEQKMIAPYQINFKAIVCGKLRRYFSLKNIFTPLLVFIGFIQSLFVLMKFKPDIVVSAGSFVAVPVVYAAWVLRIPRIIHQQDLQIGLANKLTGKVASLVTVTFSDSIGSFDYKKTYHVSNPVRKMIFQGSREKAVQLFKLIPGKSTLLVMGGGQGAEVINQVLLESIGKIIKNNFQIIHLTGAGKSINAHFVDYYDRQTIKLIEENYHAYEFLNQEIFDAYAIADLVVTRAGFSVLTELAVLAKPALLIPIPGHQEVNAQYFAKYNAAKVIQQQDLNYEVFIQAVVSLMSNPADLQNLSRNISQMIEKDAAKKYVDLIYELLK
ncbi:undecaprenyldiphospho-muramoylpentapeptide beta-N-acetylglucosaminyltransferase [Patescibacteria group bacterium]